VKAGRSLVSVKSVREEVLEYVLGLEAAGRLAAAAARLADDRASQAFHEGAANAYRAAADNARKRWRT
jgi:hypothetical protein